MAVPLTDEELRLPETLNCRPLSTLALLGVSVSSVFLLPWS
jgi:hypothetical protein